MPGLGPNLAVGRHLVHVVATMVSTNPGNKVYSSAIGASLIGLESLRLQKKTSTARIVKKIPMTSDIVPAEFGHLPSQNARTEAK